MSVNVTLVNSKTISTKTHVAHFLVYNPHFDVKVEFTFFAKKKKILPCRHYLHISEKEMST